MHCKFVKRVFSVLLVLLFLCGNSYGKNVPEDFAFGIPVETDDSTSFYRFSIPKEVYEEVTSGDLSDVRMFNGSDELVPFTIKSGTESKMAVDKKEKEVKLPLFPLYSMAGAKGSDLSLFIKRNSKGSVIKIEEKSKVKNSSKVVTSYIADLTGLDRRPDFLSFKWNGKDSTMNIKIQSSFDLTNFSTIVSKAALVDISYGNNRLNKNRVYLPYFTGRYLRIIVEKNNSGTLISGVSAHLSETSLFKRVKGRVIKPEITKSETKSSDYIIRLNGFFPVKKIRISLPQKNTIVKYQLYSGSSLDDLTHVSSGTLFKLNVEGTIITNDDIYPGYKKPDKFWLLRIDESEGGIGSGLPEISMEYHPHNLIFTARGEGPFKLLFGNYSAEPFNNSSQMMIEQLSSMKKRKMIKEVKTGAMFESGGIKRLLPPAKPVSYKKYILWGILFLGVLLTAYMAYRLISQMNREEER